MNSKVERNESMIIASMIEKIMAAAHLPGKCRIEVKGKIVSAHFVFASGVRSPIKVGTKLSRERTPEKFARKAAVSFLRSVPPGAAE